MTGVFKREPYNHEFFNMQTSLGAAVSMLDQSVNMRKQGLNPINAFYLQGFSWSWGFMDDYPYLKKRPIYYALEMYGTLQRGVLIQSSFISNTFNPFGDMADHKIMWDWLPKYDLKVHHYPVNVPTLAVYPFKNDDRYSILLINRDLKNTIQVILNLDYAPSSKVLIASLTGDDPYLYNDGYSDDPIRLNYNEVNNFTNNYNMTLAPHSAYMIINYQEGAQVHFDINKEGYGANGLIFEGFAALITLVDSTNLSPKIQLINKTKIYDTKN